MKNETHLIAGLRNTFLAGFSLLVPLFITIWVVSVVFNLLDNSIPFVRAIPVPGLSFAITLLIIFLVGLLARFYVGTKLFNGFEKLLARIPLINTVYNSSKQVVQVFSKKNTAESFERAVLIEWPRKDIYSLAYLTNDKLPWLKIDNKPHPDMACVFVPNTPSPATGFFMLVNKKDIHSINISMEDAVKMIISGGIVAPSNQNEY